MSLVVYLIKILPPELSNIVLEYTKTLIEIKHVSLIRSYASETATFNYLHYCLHGPSVMTLKRMSDEVLYFVPSAHLDKKVLKQLLWHLHVYDNLLDICLHWGLLLMRKHHLRYNLPFLWPKYLSRLQRLCSTFPVQYVCGFRHLTMSCLKVWELGHFRRLKTQKRPLHVSWQQWNLWQAWIRQ